MIEKQDEKYIKINHKTELLLWLVVLLLIVGLFSTSFMYKSKNDENDYQVFLPDVDGLIVGSSVRMMGVEVGHVVKIKPVKDEVYVKFVLTNPDVYIPQGAKVTVEFSGMAGSKSLELYLPDKNTYIDKNTPLISVEPPKRLHDALHMLDEMYKKIGSIIYSFSSFGNKLNENNFNKKKDTNNSGNFNGFLNYSDKFLDESNEKAAAIKNNLGGLKASGK